MIDGDAGPDVRALRPLRVHAIEPGRRAAGVVAVAIAERLGLGMAETTHHNQLIPKRRERSQNAR